jgi:endoglucanase
MTDFLPFLKNMISTPGLSGYEEPIRDMIQGAWQPLADEIQINRLGSLHALKRGTNPEPRHAMLFAAHMDAIGLMVSGLEGEFIRLAEVGGIDARVLPGQLVTVYGREDIPGVIAELPHHLCPPNKDHGSADMEYMIVDTGLSARQLNRQVRLGDLVSFAGSPLELSGEVLAGYSLDNRASVAALTYCLELLNNQTPNWDVWFVATTREEEDGGGAKTSAFQLRPSLAVAVDVTFAKGHGSPTHNTYPLGKGITLGWGPTIHPALFEKFKSLAEHLEIPFKQEIMPRSSGTDADDIQLIAEGIPSMLVSIPIRYMHTAVEVVALKDISRAGRLMAEFAANLDIDFMDALTWDE